MKILVGLGNPGAYYHWTRHNIGFQVVDRLAETYRISLSHTRFQTRYGKGLIRSQSVILVKPLTFMNLSGWAVSRVVHFYKAGLEDLIVIHDDLDLSFGVLRIKRRGGDGGHQGVRSIMESLGGHTFLRLKVGIGKPPRGSDAADYVLGPFDQVERPQLEEILSRTTGCVDVMISEGVEAAMNRYQKKIIPPSHSP